MRTDTHSPMNFDPSLYSYVGAFDSWREYPLAQVEVDEENYLLGLLRSSGFPGGNWERKSQCDHCGARFRYVTVWAHENGQHVAIGMTCAEERFSLPDRVSFDVKALQGRMRAAKERVEREDHQTRILADHPDLAEAFETDNYFVQDVKWKFDNYGNLSDRQIEAVLKVARETKEREAVRAAEVRVAAPEGRVGFSGVVIKVSTFLSDYSGDMVTKLTIKVTEHGDAFWLVNVSKPAALGSVDTGDVVMMTATVTRSDDDESFAFGKRPSKATRIDQSEDLVDSLA